MQLKTLQQGRGLAALAVAAFHLTLLAGLPRYLDNPVFSAFTERGNLGVDFFFVLSGFIILFAHERDIGQPQRVTNYLSKRFIRLFPVYWLYTAIFCALVMLGFGSNSIVPETPGNWISTIFLIRLDSFELPITPSWTLIHELAFYVVFATLILNRAFGAAVVVAWLVVGGVLFEYAEEGERTPLTTYFSPLNFNFLFGMLAFLAWSRMRPVLVKAGFAGGLALFAAVYVLESRGLSYEYTQLAYAASFALLIAGAAAWERDGFPAARLRLLNLIGDASYTIYLTHLAFEGLYLKIFIRIFAGAGITNAYIIYLVVLAATIASGCIVYLLVERPVLAVTRRWLLPKRARDATVSAARR